MGRLDIIQERRLYWTNERRLDAGTRLSRMHRTFANVCICNAGTWIITVIGS